MSPSAKGAGPGVPPCLGTGAGKAGQALACAAARCPPHRHPRQWGQEPAPAPSHPPCSPWHGGSPDHATPSPALVEPGAEWGLWGEAGQWAEGEGTTAASEPPWGTWVGGSGVRAPTSRVLARGPARRGRGTPGPAGGVAGSAVVLPPHGARAPSRREVVGRLGGALRPLDHRLALLPPQQLVVLEEALVAGHPVRAVRERQQPWGGKGRESRGREQRTWGLSLGRQGGTQREGSTAGQGRAGCAEPGWARGPGCTSHSSRTPPGCRALTEAIHAPAFELALEGHVVVAGEDADTAELALHELPLVPARGARGWVSGGAHSQGRAGRAPQGAELTWSRQRS